MSKRIAMAALKSKTGAKITRMLDEGVLDLNVLIQVTITNEAEMSEWVFVSSCLFFTYLHTNESSHSIFFILHVLCGN